jgi:hypothetical protein
MSDALSLYLELGFYHIVDIHAWDHLLFILALMAPIPLKAWKPWLAALSAFTLAQRCASAESQTLDFGRSLWIDSRRRILE